MCPSASRAASRRRRSSVPLLEAPVLAHRSHRSTHCRSTRAVLARTPSKTKKNNYCNSPRASVDFVSSVFPLSSALLPTHSLSSHDSSHCHIEQSPNRIETATAARHSTPRTTSIVARLARHRLSLHSHSHTHRSTTHDGRHVDDARDERLRSSEISTVIIDASVDDDARARLAPRARDRGRCGSQRPSARVERDV